MSPSILNSNLRHKRFTHFHNHAGMGVKQKAASNALQQTSGIHSTGIRKGMPQVELFLALPPAARASKLPVEGFQRLPLGSKFIFVSLDSLQNKLGFHFDVRHDGKDTTKEAEVC